VAFANSLEQLCLGYQDITKRGELGSSPKYDTLSRHSCWLRLQPPSFLPYSPQIRDQFAANERIGNGVSGYNPARDETAHILKAPLEDLEPSFQHNVRISSHTLQNCTNTPHSVSILSA
jgi:hypothetical protein